MSCSVRTCVARRAAAAAQVLHAVAEGRDDGRQRPGEGDDAGGEHGAGAGVADVGAPDLAGGHRAEHLAAGRHRRERRRHELAHHREQRQQHQPRQHAAGEHDAGDARPDDVADAHVLGRDVDVQRRVREERAARHRVADRRARQLDDPGEGLPRRPDAEAHEDGLGHVAALLAGDQDVGAGGAFRVGQRAVLLDDQRPPQRHHHQHPEHAAGEGAERDLQVGEVAGAVREEEEEGGEGEDDAGRNRLAGGPDGLDDVVLEDRRAAQAFQDRDGQHRDGNRGADGQPGAQAQVDGGGPEQQAEEHPDDHGLERELGRRLAGRHVGLERGRCRGLGRSRCRRMVGHGADTSSVCGRCARPTPPAGRRRARERARSKYEYAL